MRVTLDKPAYRPGETATVTFEAPADGAALVSVMSNRLIALETLLADAGHRPREALRPAYTTKWLNKLLGELFMSERTGRA